MYIHYVKGVPDSFDYVRMLLTCMSILVTMRTVFSCRTLEKVMSLLLIYGHMTAMKYKDECTVEDILGC